MLELVIDKIKLINRKIAIILYKDFYKNCYLVCKIIE